VTSKANLVTSVSIRLACTSVRCLRHCAASRSKSDLSRSMALTVAPRADDREYGCRAGGERCRDFISTKE
jgi:hypothetical protein